MKTKEGESDLPALKKHITKTLNSIKTACYWRTEKQMGQKRWYIEYEISNTTDQ